MEEKTFSNKTFSEEREFYLKDGLVIDHCNFEGEGESPFKENSNLNVFQTRFALRYACWHVKRAYLNKVEFTDLARAPFWYAEDIKFDNSSISAPKAFRECFYTILHNDYVHSEEVFWKCKNVYLYNCDVSGMYAFFMCENINITGINFKGKYSFQYVKGGEVANSKLDTKDAFWHSSNMIIRDSDIDGEYIGWYSDGLTFINCKISGTQPFCYAKNLKLINCEMTNADRAFEYSDVEAEINSEIDSIKNPHSGRIICKGVKEIISSDSKMKNTCEIIIKK